MSDPLPFESLEELSERLAIVAKDRYERSGDFETEVAVFRDGHLNMLSNEVWAIPMQHDLSMNILKTFADLSDSTEFGLVGVVKVSTMPIDGSRDQMEYKGDALMTVAGHRDGRRIVEILPAGEKLEDFEYEKVTYDLSVSAEVKTEKGYRRYTVRHDPWQEDFSSWHKAREVAQREG